MKISAIVPAYNAAATLPVCLEALASSTPAVDEIIVVDDGSADETPVLAERLGARVLRQKRAGPAAARNAGAEAAGGDVLVFVDADVAVHPSAVGLLVAALESGVGAAASFGSYDTQPKVTGAVAMYRNLLHAYTHQTGNREASTFWAGLGAVRREAFLGAGGFDASKFERASIEDIEFGMRLRQAGRRVVLAPEAQGSHLKEWTLRSMVMTDLWCRAVPWTRLLRRGARMPNDLNLRWSQRLSVAAVWLAPAGGLASLADGRMLVSVPLLLAFQLLLNFRFYSWVAHCAGLRRGLSVIPLHWLFHWIAGLGYLIGHIPTQSQAAPAADPRGAEHT